MDNRDVVNALAVFGEQRIQSRATAFRTASLRAVFGDVTLDLSEARLAPEGAVIDAMSAFGEIAVVVPEGWRVTVDDTNVGTDLEEPQEAVETATGPELRVRRTGVFGGVTVTRRS